MGVVPNLVGSTLDEVMREGMGAQRANLEQGWERVKAIYSEQGSKYRVRQVTKEMIKGPFAHLTRCKAAEYAAL
eukprot:13397114-Alexandrium_andersonii.AAC.1